MENNVTQLTSLLLLSMALIHGCDHSDESADGDASTLETGYFVGEYTVHIPEGYGIASGEYEITYEPASEVRTSNTRLGLDPAGAAALYCESDCSQYTSTSPGQCPSMPCQVLCYSDSDSSQQFPIPVGGGFCYHTGIDFTYVQTSPTNFTNAAPYGLFHCECSGG